MERFFIGFVITGLGLLLAMKTSIVYDFFGNIEFFDKYLGTSGGSRLGYKIIGFLFIFIGVLTMTGLINAFMAWLLSPLLQFSQPSGNI